ncbi:beta-L-arabinofuranosidase domain-containing protein [Cohnella boryungensis]|uniref:Beta-L-arabinofuranosidase domain-containing protein n=1 Tax=Cohnella boryungensis TaxID=768479 RepID=A0ABV8S5F3_9BACL
MRFTSFNLNEFRLTDGFFAFRRELIRKYIQEIAKVNPANEFGGLGDALYTLYDLTGDAALLELAAIFDRDYWIEPLAAGKDVLEDLHANAHLPTHRTPEGKRVCRDRARIPRRGSDRH